MRDFAMSLRDFFFTTSSSQNGPRSRYLGQMQGQGQVLGVDDAADVNMVREERLGELMRDHARAEKR